MRKATWTALVAALVTTAVLRIADASGTQGHGERPAAFASLAGPGDLGEQAEGLGHGSAFVLGIGEQPAGTQALFYVRARSVPAISGKPPATGIMTFETTDGPALLWDAKVTCVKVSGDDAVVTGVVNIPRRYAGEHIVMEGIDNSKVGDRMRFSFQHNGGVVQGSSPFCWKPDLPPVNIQSGFVEVVPAAPRSAAFGATGSGTASGAVTTTLKGTVQGSDLGHGTFSGTELTGSPPPRCGSGRDTPTTGFLDLTAADGDVLHTKFSDTVCQTSPPKLVFDVTGSYTITGGTGKFANATGAGAMTAHAEFGPTFRPGPCTFSYRGTIALHQRSA